MEGNMEDFKEISGVTQTWILHIYELWGKEGGLRTASNYRARVDKWSERNFLEGENVSWLEHRDMDGFESFKDDH